MWKINLIPELQDFCLVGWHDLLVRFIPVNILCWADQEYIIDVTFQPLQSTPEDEDPDDQWDEQLPDYLWGLSTEIIVSVDIPLPVNGHNLKDLIEWVHGELTISGWYVHQIWTRQGLHLDHLLWFIKWTYQVSESHQDVPQWHSCIDMPRMWLRLIEWVI